MKVLASILLVMISFVVKAQKPSGIVNAYAFMREHFAGTIAVDDKGNDLPRGVDTINLVYIETKGGVPALSRAWRNGAAYSVTLVPVKDNPLELGNRQVDDKKLVLRPQAGTTLWQLQLEPIQEKRARPAVKNYKHNDLILEGSYNKNRFVYTIKGIIMLAPIPSV